MKRIIVFSMTDEGGLAEYVYNQSEALEKRGWDVLFLCTSGYFRQRVRKFDHRESLLSMPHVGLPSLLRRPLLAAVIVLNYLLLAWYLVRERPEMVLLDSYREYLSPLWAWSLRASSSISGAFMVANLHDPVRNYRIGPVWWHEWSVQQGYSFLDLVTVHAQLPPGVVMPKKVRVAIVPHGVFTFKPTGRSRSELRKSLGVAEDGFLVLSFGFIRDNKNIDLLVKAISQLPSYTLLVAGRSQTSNDKPVSYYRNMARSLKVEDRCVFVDEFIPNDRIPEFFEACDIIALTYSSNFYSQSGVLNLAAAAAKPVLVSSAEGPLLETVRRFRLGKVIRPDDQDAVTNGLREMASSIPKADWEAYYQYAGWEKNIEIIESEYEKR